MNEIQEVIAGLKCLYTIPREKTIPCEECRYRVLEEVDNLLPVKPDVIIDGKAYWEGCDFDQIMKDAADMLEKMSKEGK